MTTFKHIVVLILFFSFMVFVAFFGRLPAFRRTPVAGLHRLIWVHIPKGVLALDQTLTSGRLSSSLLRFSRYMMYDRHWTVVILFTTILLVSEYLFIPAAWSEIGWFTKLTASVTIILPYLFLYLACSSDPGYITSENHAYHFSLYPYDHTLFHPGHECKTCHFLKPARSKHCSICKKCVARADHHCIFINKCVGYGNHHWFLLLLLSTGVLTLYGGGLGLSILTSKMKLRSPHWTLLPPKHMTFDQYLAVWGWGIQYHINLGATTLLAVLTSPLVWGLLLYTVWLVYCGTTTNESLKWSEWKEDMADGYAFRRSMPADRKHADVLEPRLTRWPVEAEQILVTTNNGQPPKDDEAHLPGEGPWERVWNLRHVENLYDLGFWDNMVDVFVRDYPYGKRGDEPVVERRRRNR